MSKVLFLEDARRKREAKQSQEPSGFRGGTTVRVYVKALGRELHIPIQDIRLNDSVMTLRGWRKVTGIVSRDYVLSAPRTTRRLTLSNGISLDCAPAQEFWTPQYGLCTAKELHVGMNLETGDFQLEGKPYAETIYIRDVSEFLSSDTLYCLTVDGPGDFIVAGVVAQGV